MNQWLRVGFSGSRKGMSGYQSVVIIAIIRSQYIGSIHHGDCLGADSEVHNFAKERGIKTIIHPPINDRFIGHNIGDEYRDKKPYLIRNQEIVKESTILLAAPLDLDEDAKSGTWATIRYARKLGRPIFIVLINGTIQIEGGAN